MGAQGAARVRSTASWKAVAEKAVPAYREAILAAGISRSMP
jgi:hypothetical protein